MRYHVLDVFTDRPYSGNPLAVVLGADDLDRARLQRVAREFNLSETAFLLPPTRADAGFRVRIFTPTEELPFAGHPVVGAACLLTTLGVVPAGGHARFVFETGAGPVPVFIHNQGDASYAELTAPQRPEVGEHQPDVDAIARVLGLERDAIGYQDETPCVASCGLPMLLVPLRAPELLAGIDDERPGLRSLLDGCGGARGLYVYARGYEGELRARMFSPTLGEDPATGSAVAALAGRLALASVESDRPLAWNVVQGAEMGRPSTLHAFADRVDGQIVAVRVGGHAVQVMEGIIHGA
ncbi:MAG: PhzF family phenazine biosynthesis protein [Panacagrimonas sp.]